MATKKVLACRHMRSLQLLYTVGGDLASPRTKAKSTFFYLKKGGGESWLYNRLYIT